MEYEKKASQFINPEVIFGDPTRMTYTEDKDDEKEAYQFTYGDPPMLTDDESDDKEDTGDKDDDKEASQFLFGDPPILTDEDTDDEEDTRESDAEDAESESFDRQEDDPEMIACYPIGLGVSGETAF